MIVSNNRIAEGIRGLLRRFPAAKRLATRFYTRLPGRLRVDPRFLGWLAFMETTESWSKEQFEEYQLERLRDLLSELRRSSKYYREILKDVNIAHLASVADFQHQVPFTDRTTFRQRYQEILCDDWRKRRLVAHSTSGTTGMGLRFYHMEEDEAREWAAVCQQWMRVGYDPLRSVRAEFRGLTHSPHGVDHFPLLNMIRCSILNFDADHLARYAEEIRAANVEFFNGYPGSLYLLAKAVERLGVRFPEPRAIMLASEMVYDWQLDKIRNVFPNSRILDFYGCAERTVIGGWCETEEVYHISPHYSLVEIDPTTREIIGTNLYNTVNGFVRYPMTDLAENPSWAPCPACGRFYVPRFEALAGRAADFLFSRTKGWLAPALITFPFKAASAFGEAQLIQRAEDEFTILFTNPEHCHPGEISETQGKISAGMHRLFGDSIRIHFEQTDRIPRAPSGKFRWVVSELPQPYDP